MERKVLWAGVTSSVEVDIWKWGKSAKFGAAVTRSVIRKKARSMRVIIEVDE